MSTLSPNATPTLERDPVCGMNVHPATAKHVYRHQGKNYYFCCPSCADKFKADPSKYPTEDAPSYSPGLVTLGGDPKTQPSNTSSPIKSPTQANTPSYVCPMCPEVRENTPGACPSCGMAIEPAVPVSSTRTEYTC